MAVSSSEVSNKYKSALVGAVVGTSMDKTVTVAVRRRVRHARYGKVVSRITKLKAHDEKNACKVGDQVSVVGTRPLSKTKHWLVVRIIRSIEEGSGV
tara:strand:+ start:3085 stop:3375 length:291 start_codon:yes stop_codon:yes gene_type:complete